MIIYLKRLFRDLMISLVITFCLQLNSNALFGQEMDRLELTYTWFDEIIGKTNSGIFKGNEYVEENNMTNESHKFFKKSFFLIGSVTYDSQTYFNLEIKYDVFGDQLLLRNSEVKDVSVIVLTKNNISKFIIDGYEFKNIQMETVNKAILSGFFEVLLNTDSIVLYKKHTKKKIKVTKNNLRYDGFKDGYQYYISYCGDYFRLSKTDGLNKIFPNHKSQLKNIASQYSSIKKVDPDNYMKSVLIDLSNIILNENNNTGL